MTVKDRLIAFIKSQNIAQSAFEKRVGLSNGYVNNIRRSIQPDKIEKISTHYPELNTGWLLTGEGEMQKDSLLNTNQNNTVETLQSIEASKIIENQQSVIESQQRTIETLSRTIEILSKKD